MGIVVVRLPRTLADFWESKINTKGKGGVVEFGLELVDDLAQLLWGVSESTDAAQAASVGDSCGKGPAAGARHSREQDGVLDVEEGGEGGGDCALAGHGCGWVLFKLALEGR